MPVILHFEWDNPKELKRLKRYYEYAPTNEAVWKKKLDAGLVKKTGSWSDGTGHIIALIEFEDMVAFAKVWNDEEIIEDRVKFCRLVDNPMYRILIPVVPLPPE